jgi:flagellar motor protein MotB
MVRKRASLLHLQLGQEVIYLIMTSAMFAAVILALLVSDSRAREQAARENAAQSRTELDKIKEGVSDFASMMRERDQMKNSLDAERKRWETLKKQFDAISGNRTSDAVVELERAKQELSALKLKQEQIEDALRDAERRLRESTDKPPIVVLSQAKDFRFKFGSAEPDAGFRSRMASSIIPDLVENARRYRVDVIEVVGHTDEAPLARKTTNLDGALLDYLNRKSSQLPFGADNVGLGMARAAAVVRLLMEDGRLVGGYRIVALSAGQTIEVDGSIAKGTSRSDEEQRRRIEIRMRRRD